MARTAAQIEEELELVRCAMRAMLSTKESSVGLTNAYATGDRSEQGMRPTYAQLQEREKELLIELNAARFKIFRTIHDKGL